jgi:CheY-like chemotaxis protein
MACALVVDDNPTVRTTIGVILEHEEHCPILAEIGHASARAIQSQPIDLLIVDLFMPEMGRH